MKSFLYGWKYIWNINVLFSFISSWRRSPIFTLSNPDCFVKIVLIWLLWSEDSIQAYVFSATYLTNWTTTFLLFVFFLRWFELIRSCHYINFCSYEILIILYRPKWWLDPWTFWNAIKGVYFSKKWGHEWVVWILSWTTEFYHFIPIVIHKRGANDNWII